MNLIIIRKNTNYANGSGNGLLRSAICSESISTVIFDGLSKCPCWGHKNKTVYAIPEGWGIQPQRTGLKIIPYEEDVPFPDISQKTKRNSWFIISDGRFATRIDRNLLYKALASIRADVVAVDVKPELLAHHEKMRFTAQGNVAGFRHLYSDFSETAPIPSDWPHHIFIKNDARKQVLTGRTLCQSFSAFSKRCQSNALTLQAVSIGGNLLDLDTEEGLLGLLSTTVNSTAQNYHNLNNAFQKKFLSKDGITISDSARLFGKILFEQNISIGQNVIILGPAIICNDVKIANGAVVRASIIGPGVSIPHNALIQNRVLIGPQNCQKRRRRSTNSRILCRNFCEDNFRIWPTFSYARCLKRIADIISAIIVLILFAPVFPIIALVVKLTSRGPVFFKDTRQGLHGKAFNCLKFRTMPVGADEIQDKLRVLNEADGPQFKMTDDPRISPVGGFLRDTYIDEIPQFLNVLLGQMSLIGPRPSPEVENTLCPPWRDARLSVRPGVTGLWQVCRTRQPMKDFQEWIYYDIKYVRSLSLRLDLWICWQTIKKLAKSFISQF